MTLTLSAIVLHQDAHSIVLSQGPTTQKPRVQKRPACAVMKKPAAGSAKPATGSASIAKRPSAKVLKKPAAGSAARNYNSPPISVSSGSSIDDDMPLSALSSCATTPTRAPLGRTLTVQTTEPYELEEGVDYSSAGTPSSTLSSEMDAQLRRMGWAR